MEDQAAIAARNRQQLEQLAKDRLPVQFPQLPSHAEIQQLANNNDNDSTSDSDNDNTAFDEENHPIYWRDQQQQPIKEWLAAHPNFNVTHPSVNKPATQLFQNTVHFGKCVAATEPSINNTDVQFLIEFTDGHYAPLTTPEFNHATHFYHRENRLRQSRQRRHQKDPPVLVVAAARSAHQNFGAAKWPEGRSEGDTTNPVVFPHHPQPTPPIPPHLFQQPPQHRTLHQVHWPEDDGMEDLNQHQWSAAKAKIVHTDLNPTLHMMQNSPALTAKWQPLFHEWFESKLASGQVRIVSVDEATALNAKYITHLLLTKTKANGDPKVRNAPNGSVEDSDDFANLWAGGIDQAALRRITAMAAHYNLQIRQKDVIDAYGNNNTWEQPDNIRTQPLVTWMQPWETGRQTTLLMLYGVPNGCKDAPSLYDKVQARSFLKSGLQRFFTDKNVWIMRNLLSIYLKATYVDDHIDALSRTPEAEAMAETVQRQLDTDNIRTTEKRLDDCPDGITFLAHRITKFTDQYGTGYALAQPQQASALRQTLLDMGVTPSPVFTPVPADWSAHISATERHLNTPAIVTYLQVLNSIYNDLTLHTISKD